MIPLINVTCQTDKSLVKNILKGGLAKRAITPMSNHFVVLDQLNYVYTNSVVWEFSLTENEDFFS